MALGQRLRTIGVGFGGAAVIFGLVFWVVGLDRILTELRTARPMYIGLVVLGVVGWLGAWSLSLRTVLDSLDIPLSAPHAFALFTGATFANNVTPFGQAGGEPITAWLLSDASDASYEQGTRSHR